MAGDFARWMGQEIENAEAELAGEQPWSPGAKPGPAPVSARLLTDYTDTPGYAIRLPDAESRTAAERVFARLDAAREREQ